MDSKTNDSKKTNLVFLITLLSLFALQIWKASRGMGGVDEDFYITLGYRLVKGDALIYDEWHITQLISVFLAPLIRIYITLTGGMTGIVRFFRIAYALLNAAAGTAIYCRFRSEYGITAVIASIIYMLFTPFNIMALSYNTMSIAFLVLSLMIWKKESTGCIVLSGLFFGCAVLNTPYLILLYLPFTVFMIRRKETYGVKLWSLFTAGAAVIAVLFLGVLFSRTSFSQLTEGLSHVVDKGHSDSVLWLLVKGGGKLFQAFGLFFGIFILEVIAVIFLRKNKRKHNEPFIAVMTAVNMLSAVYVVWIRPYFPDLGGHALVLFPFALTGLILLLSEGLEGIRFEAVCFFTSAFHALMVAVSSNVGPRSFCSMLITACSVTILLLGRRTDRRTLSAAFTLLFSGILLVTKITGLYDGPESFDTRIERGPFAGLYDTAENAALYYDSLQDIETINAEPGDYAMLVTYKTWEYLALDKRVATNSAFINSGFEEEWVENQFAYHAMHPDKYPAYVYLDHNDTPYQWTGSEMFFQQLTQRKELKNGILYIYE